MKRSKYGAKKTIIDDIKFDSKIEGQYYLYLKDLKDKGEIESFILQPKFILQDKFEKHGIKYRQINYVSDFLIKYKDKLEEVIDIKGMATNEAKMKRKMFNYKYPNLILKWIVYIKKRGGRIGYDENKKMVRDEKKKRTKEG